MPQWDRSVTTTKVTFTSGRIFADEVSMRNPRLLLPLALAIVVAGLMVPDRFPDKAQSQTSLPELAHFALHGRQTGSDASASPYNPKLPPVHSFRLAAHTLVEPRQ